VFFCFMGGVPFSRLHPGFCCRFKVHRKRTPPFFFLHTDWNDLGDLGRTPNSFF
jgi:hypothetical protein